MADKLRRIAIIIFALASTSATMAQDKQLNFPKNKKLNSVAVSYFDGLPLAGDCEYKTPSFHYRYETALAQIANGQGGSIGVGYDGGIGVIKVPTYELTPKLLAGYDTTLTYTTAARLTTVATVSYHYPIADYFDAYARLHIGMVPTVSNQVDNPSFSDYLTYGGVVGVQYMIKGKFGVFVEVGAADQVISAGLTWGGTSSVITQVIGKAFGLSL